MRKRRSLLFVPGDDLHKISKAAQSAADCVILELEDGVALNRKAEARQVIQEALHTIDFGPREKLVRLNPIGSEFFEDDFRQTIDGHPNSYVIPKTESAFDIAKFSDQLAHAECDRGWDVCEIRLIIVIETPKGVMNLRELAQSTLRLEALMFGAEDLAGAMGAVRSKAGWEVFYARSAVVTAAAAYDLQAIDQIYADFNDMAGLAEDCAFARQLGYSGKIAIHPRQIEAINTAFSPSTTEIERAERLMKAFVAQQENGKGAFVFEDKMVDQPMIRQAQRILGQAVG